VFLHQKGQKGTIKIVSACTQYVGKHYGHIKNSNIPIICDICDPPKDTERKRRAVWKYNFPEHMLAAHPRYKVPGWPQKKGTHTAQSNDGGEIGLLAKFAAALDFAPYEEVSFGVSESTTWSSLVSVGSKHALDNAPADLAEPAVKYART
jgi:hypothetical protein